MASHDIVAHEGTPLLEQGRKPKTPLPWNRLSIIFLAVFMEPVVSQHMSLFTPRLIGELGITRGDERKIGYYTGLIEFSYYVAQALSIWYWSRLSDFIGRRPVVLVSLVGLCVSNIAFGLSRSLATLVISRCIAGIFNARIPVLMSMLGDITGHTNIVRVFTIAPALFCVGYTVAPLYGNALVKPQEQPLTFRGEFWATHPYFLPCLVSGCLALLTFALCAASLEESLPSKTSRSTQPKRPTADDALDSSPTDDGQPIPLSALLEACSTMAPIVNYGMLALVEGCFLVLLPQFYSSPVELGGLGFPPSIAVTILTIFGIVNASIQILFAPRLISRLGAKTLFRSAILCYYPLLLFFPIMTGVVTAQGKIGPLTWILVVFQLVFLILLDLSYTVIYIFITRGTPNKCSLGSVNGVAQSLLSVSVAIAAPLVTWLFAFSKQDNALGGNLVYVVLAVLCTFLVALSRRLPDLRDLE